MRMFRRDCTTLQAGRLIGCADKLINGFCLNKLQGRGSKVTSVAGVQRGAFGCLEHQVHPRTELIRVSVLVHHIEACSKVDRQWLEYLPLVLEIKSVVGAGLALVVDDRDRDVRRLNSRRVNRKKLVIRGNPRGLYRDKKPATQNVTIIDGPARVELHTTGKDASIDPTREASEN